MNAVIIEDEIFSSNVLRSMISEYCPDVHVMEEINSSSDALQKLPELNPDLIFLDIELGDGDAFDMLHKLNGDAPPIIFTTAFNDFAIRAFRLSAVDYLLKPISIKELIAAVNRAKSLSNDNEIRRRFQCLLENSNTQRPLKQIALPTLSGYYFVEIDHIVRFEAEGSYSRIFLVNKEEHLLSYNLKYFEDLLKSENFFRVHYSHYINLNMISKYVKGSGGYVVMKDGSKVDVATRRKEDLLRAVGIF
jgi:two-component system, LytTR family, response regulator